MPVSLDEATDERGDGELMLIRGITHNAWLVHDEHPERILRNLVCGNRCGTIHQGVDILAFSGHARDSQYHDMTQNVAVITGASRIPFIIAADFNVPAQVM